MKQLFSLFLLSIISMAAFTQTPKLINYQAVARNNSGQPLANQVIKVKLSIISSETGNPVLYYETKNVNTNALGLFHVQIGGGGAIEKAGDFTTIDWTNNPGGSKMLKVEIALNDSGTFIDLGLQTLSTVPYSFVADNTINIGGHPVSTTNPSIGDVLKWNGTTWIPQPPAATYNLQKPMNWVNGGSLAFAWAAQPIQVTVYEGQLITFVASATLATSSGTATAVAISPCYQGEGTSITAFTSSNYLTVATLSQRAIYPATGTLKVVAANASAKYGEIPAGTYNFGLGIRNTSSIPINNSSEINGFLMVQ